MSFYRATDTPVLDFWWRLPWVSKSEWAALFALGGGARINVYVPCNSRTHTFIKLQNSNENVGSRYSASTTFGGPT